MSKPLRVDELNAMFQKRFKAESTEVTSAQLESALSNANRDWCFKRVNGGEWECRWGLSGRFVTGPTIAIAAMKALEEIKK